MEVIPPVTREDQFKIMNEREMHSGALKKCDMGHGWQFWLRLTYWVILKFCLAVIRLAKRSVPNSMCYTKNTL